MEIKFVPQKQTVKLWLECPMCGWEGTLNEALVLNKMLCCPEDIDGKVCEQRLDTCE